jgi:hypothetical protein
MAMIRAKEYGETEERLTKDPIVIEMAHGLADTPREQLVHEADEDGEQPRFEFMMAANKEYRERGGTDGGHIGAVATALLKVLDSGEVKPTKVVTYFATRDSLTASRDEDAAMAHASIASGETSETKAREALSDYMVKEARSLSKHHGSYELHQRAQKLAIVAVGEVMTREFEGDSDWEAINFDIDGLRFRLVRVTKHL